MGLRGITFLVIIFLIIVFVFGTKRLRSFGEDLAAALKGFRKGMREDEESPKDKEQQ